MTRTAAATPKLSTRDKLIAAAHALIWRNSYAHVSVDEICRAAGVQKGSFYHFFPTKADLAAAALEDHWLEAKPKMEAIFRLSTPQAQLKAFCAEMMRKQTESLKETGKICGCPYATMASEMSGNNEQLTKLSQQMSERFHGYYELLLKNAAAAKLIPIRGLKQRAHEMQIYSMGAMLQARFLNSLEPVGKQLETALFRISGMTEKATKASTRHLPADQVPVRLVKKR